MRKLASIQRVLGIYPIKDADFIETARINGWQCIVRKGEFKVGDLGVYFEIDSVPPPTPVFEFLWAPNPAPSGSFRIRTKKLRGVVSQGLLMPLSSFTEMSPGIFVEGQEVTEQLGVKKYEVPIKVQGLRVAATPYGPFAADVPKTDEDRLQSSGDKLLDELRGFPYVITEKCDGTSATFNIDRDGVFRVYSRNWEIAPATQPGRFEAAYLGLVRWFAVSVLFKVPRWRALANKLRIWVHKRSHRRETLYWDIARKYNIEAALRERPSCALQGEIVGPGVQKNLMGLESHELRAFDLYGKASARHLGQDSFDSFCKANGIPQARVVERGESFAHTQESLLKLAEAKYEGTKNEREGIVVRALVPRHSMVLGGRLSFKVISNRYLLAEKEEDE